MRPGDDQAILTDDQGWDDLTCYNPESKIATPNMDRLASEGLRMLNAYAPACVCSPTRYGFLTGRYPWRTCYKQGVLYHYDPSRIRPGRMTLGTLYQQLGYITGAMGKWPLGLDWQPQPGDWMTGQAVHYADKNKIGARIDLTKPITVGPIGILNHTQEDAEGRLLDNLDGLQWLVPQLDDQTPAAKPKYRTWKENERRYSLLLQTMAWIDLLLTSKWWQTN